MTDLSRRLFDELESLVLIDPHTHINPHAAASKTLADIMGYHYYTELAHSAGMPKAYIEDKNISPKERVGRLVEKLGDPVEHDSGQLADGHRPRVFRLPG